MPDCCAGKTKIVYPCSGAADVGEMADKVARKISKETDVKMGCLAGVGGNISGFVLSSKEADFIFAIDGCPMECAKKTLLSHGIEKFKHLRITDLGFAKGKMPVSEENINKAFDKAKELI